MASFWVGRKIRAAEGLRSVSYTHLDVYKRQGEVFTVTVPTSEQHDPYVVGLKRRYAAIVGSATAVFTVVGFASAAMGNAGGVLGALIVGSLAVTAGGYALMLAFRAKMSAYKAKRGWTCLLYTSRCV